MFNATDNAAELYEWVFLMDYEQGDGWEYYATDTTHEDMLARRNRLRNAVSFPVMVVRRTLADGSTDTVYRKYVTHATDKAPVASHRPPKLMQLEPAEPVDLPWRCTFKGRYKYKHHRPGRKRTATKRYAVVVIVTAPTAVGARDKLLESYTDITKLLIAPWSGARAVAATESRWQTPAKAQDPVDTDYPRRDVDLLAN